MPDEREFDLMLALVRADGREIVGGMGLGYEFTAEFCPELVEEGLFDDRAPVAPGFYVWEGVGTFSGVPGYLQLAFEGTWRPASPLDLAMLGVDDSWN